MGKWGGKQPGAGRPKGVPNKLNGDIKAMILGALEDVGGRDYLAARALDTPVAFMGLIGKVLPLQLTGENGAPIAVDFRWADATPAQDHDMIEANEPVSITFVDVGEC